MAVSFRPKFGQGLPCGCLRGSTTRRRSSVAATAKLVPDFPRLVEPVREWLADGVPALSGFNGDDLTRLLFSDLLDDPGRVLWVGALAVAGLVAAVTFEAETMGSPEQLRSPAEQQRWERKRGVTWLALATLAAIWCTGVVNRPAPFQP